MMQAVINKIFGKRGSRTSEPQKQNSKTSLFRSGCLAKSDSDFRSQLTEEPMNFQLHYQFAEHCLQHGNATLAYAELKTALALGMNHDEIKRLESDIYSSLPAKENMDHNQYFRFHSLSSAVRKLSNGNHVSVVDVGGGQGQLAQFIPEASYFLAEPKVNGISGGNLPFLDKSIDYVIACHVLEHIPPAGRDQFLDHLLAKAKYGLILLNPFEHEKISAEERLKLFIEITGADWAIEHLECTLPKIERIKKYARLRGLVCNIQPNGTLTTSMAMVFVDYFANKAGLTDDLAKVNRFLNMRYADILNFDQHPNAYLVMLSQRE